MPPRGYSHRWPKKKPTFANEMRPTLLAHELTEKPNCKIYPKKKLPTNLVGQPIVYVGSQFLLVVF